jgi:hypothetical protein
MKWLRSLLTRLFRRPTTDWDSMPYGPPATVEDELARLNNER